MINQQKNKKNYLNKIIICLIGLFFILLIFIIYISITPTTAFNQAKKDITHKIKILTNNSYKQLLFYRKQYSWSSAPFVSTCYVMFIQLNDDYQPEQTKLFANGFQLIDKYKCFAKINNLSNTKLTFAAPNFHYLGYEQALSHKEFLIYGSTKNLNIININSQKKQIWYKREKTNREYEFIFYPQQNIIQVNMQEIKCTVPPLIPAGDCNKIPTQ
ncbi:MAG: hypothetical protein IJV35_10875 [Neisseriaceae bacterium]|nr:hypothetical protein [Neisseriaceae bacterium]